MIDTNFDLLAALDAGVFPAIVELAKERARLDWLISKATYTYSSGRWETKYFPIGKGATVREAIDAAMKEQSK